MIIDCIADLHGHYPKLEGGDLLIVAGDCTARDDEKGWSDFDQWLYEQRYKKKILVAGNHDNFLQSIDEHRMWKYWEKNPGVTYLCDSGTEFEYEYECPPPKGMEGLDVAHSEKRKLKIWGSPWTKTFPGMNPHCKAFTVDTEDELFDKWELIPHDVDILVTHSPPYGILDKTTDDRHVGSKGLHGAIVYCFRPKLWVFGHVHEAYGKKIFKDSTICINASHVDEKYRPVNKPVRVQL